MLGLQDSLWALVLVYPTFTIPFCTWLLMGFFKTVPPEVEEAAIVDGCNILGSFFKVVLPLSVPAVLTAVIFSFTLSLQDFVYALSFISTSAQKPVILGLATDLVRGDIYFSGELMAGALIASISRWRSPTTSFSTVSSPASPAAPSNSGSCSGGRRGPQAPAPVRPARLALCAALDRLRCWRGNCVTNRVVFEKETRDG